MRILSKIIASFFGIGYFPAAPGTVSSFILVLLYKYVCYDWSWPVYAAAGIFLYAVGIFTASSAEAGSSREDPRFVVIDEILGQWIALFQLPPSWPMILAAFFLFRFFDIVKPFWIRRAEKFSGGWGIMLDDILAGLYTGILVNLYLILS